MFNHEENNYRNDPRVCNAQDQASFDSCCDVRRMVYTLNREDESGEIQTFTLPIMRVVCPTCDGRGTHVNPSIDAGGIAGDDEDFWSEDLDYEDEDEEGNPVSRYHSGVYDVQCGTCHGNNVVCVINRTGADLEALEAWDSLCEDQEDYEAERAAERRWGC